MEAAEKRFVLDSVRPWLDGSERQRLGSWLAEHGGAMSWEATLETVARLRVAPLMWWNLRAAARAIPRNPRQYLLSFHLYHRERNAILLRETAAMLGNLAEAGILAAVRKGIYLAHRVYPDPGARPMNDIDLLVSRDAAAGAVAVLERMGYRAGTLGRDGRTIQPEPRERQLFWRMHTNNMPTMLRTTDSEYASHIAVDIVVDLFLPKAGFAVNVSEMLERSERRALGGVEARVLMAEDFLLDLCAHTFKESTTLRYIEGRGHQRLIQYCDVVAFLTHPEARFDWSRFLSIASDYEVEGPCYFTLAHVETLFPGVVPAEIIASLAARAGKDEAYLHEFGAIDLDRPRVSSLSIIDRIFASGLPDHLPGTRSPV